MPEETLPPEDSDKISFRERLKYALIQAFNYLFTLPDKIQAKEAKLRFTTRELGMADVYVDETLYAIKDAFQADPALVKGIQTAFQSEHDDIKIALANLSDMRTNTPEHSNLPPRKDRKGVWYKESRQKYDFRSDSGPSSEITFNAFNSLDGAPMGGVISVFTLRLDESLSDPNSSHLSKRTFTLIPVNSELYTELSEHLAQIHIEAEINSWYERRSTIPAAYVPPMGYRVKMSINPEDRTHISRDFYSTLEKDKQEIPIYTQKFRRVGNPIKVGDQDYDMFIEINNDSNHNDEYLPVPDVPEVMPSPVLA